MADNTEDSQLGRSQRINTTGSASKYHTSSKRKAEDSGDDLERHHNSSSRFRGGSNITTSDEEFSSDHGALLSTSADRKPEQRMQLHETYRPKFTIDWRVEILRFLAIPHELSDDQFIEAMRDASEKLKEVERLKAMAQNQQSPPKAQVIHEVHCHIYGNGKYLDQPWVVKTEQWLHLRGSQSINNFELFLERNKEISFIVYRHYECCNPSVISSRREQGAIGVEIDASALLQREHVHVLADELKKALADIFETALQDIPWPDFDDETDRNEMDSERGICHPYLWYYHGRREIEQKINELPLAERRYIDPFRDYIQARMAANWMAVDAVLKEGMITAAYIDYLFVPGRIVISQQNGKSLSQLEAFVAQDWLRKRQSGKHFAATIDVQSWKFDGRFLKTEHRLHVDGLPSLEEKFNIIDLPIYPMRFANEEVVEALRSRGQMFWKCRIRKYVSYVDTEAADATQDMTDSRYMVDIATYKRMHRGQEPEPPVVGNDTENEEQLSPELMEHDTPDLGDDFFMCLPTSIQGFNMQNKEWINLYTYFIKDVVWNTAAFEFLVINQETKTLVRAVVTNHIRGQGHTDLISGKGNGLFILLHGGPGTGKTLTAESVAEIAKKPLYRVTCGDIGTKAEDVEKYLDYVLFLGRTWNCVVLLDEADVFLEQRSLVNLERNALVSVFLRVLEYYDGILILTSNRVGIFDEAFKSRIQLNLRYKALDENQRLQIWTNSLERLEGLEQKLHGGDAHSHEINMNEIKGLAKAELNGRQIRNSISTARKLATHLNEPLGVSHIKTVIKEVETFDKYLYELNNRFTSEEIQRHKMVR